MKKGEAPSVITPDVAPDLIGHPVPMSPAKARELERTYRIGTGLQASALLLSGRQIPPIIRESLEEAAQALLSQKPPAKRIGRRVR